MVPDKKTSGYRLTERKRLIFYMLYAWGIALFLTLITFLMDQVDISDDLKPRIGESICFFERMH